MFCTFFRFVHIQNANENQVQKRIWSITINLLHRSVCFFFHSPHPMGFLYTRINYVDMVDKAFEMSNAFVHTMSIIINSTQY